MDLVKIAINCLLLGTLISCAMTLNDIKFMPKYQGVDPKIAPYASEWLSLAKDNGLTFKHTVTIGIKNIGHDYIVGLCTYGPNFREIDIDRKYWDSSTESGKIALIYHELAHCYCYRKHDYGDGKEYGDKAEDARKDPDKQDGFFKDKCPISLMFPEVVEDDCVQAHYGEYIKEVFNRCEEY